MALKETMAQSHTHVDPQQSGRYMRWSSLLAVTVALVLIGLKGFAWLSSGSVALLGSLLDSVLDFSISFINFFAIRHALEPADEEHRFGHGKAEALAALGQGLIIGGSALFLAWQSVESFRVPSPIAHSNLAILIVVISIILTLGLVAVQRWVARKTGSLAVAADSAHYEGDLYMNVAVIGALVLSSYTTFTYADPILGLVVTFILLNSALAIIRKAGHQLMDHEASDKTREALTEIIMSHPEVQSVHDLRTRRAGTQLFVQCHIELDGKMSLTHAHDISDRVEMMVMERFPNAEMIIHQDPAGLENVSELEKV